MAGNGPDDPNYYSDSEPTAYAANYGGYGQQPGEPPPETPWYRKPAALVAFGALIALLLALIVWLSVSLMSDDSSGSTETTTTTTTSTSGSASEVAPTQTVTETTSPPSTSTETTAPSTETTTTEFSISTSISTSTSTVTVSPPSSNPQVPQIPQIPQIPIPGAGG